MNQIYKNNIPLTDEQIAKHKQLVVQGDIDLAKFYLRKCLEENYTDEFRQKMNQGLVEGVGLEDD